ncbi:pilus assembly protein HofN [Cronobacter condimenti 1330]|uniref:Pilus assembly protein HofN n=1 Tax=Cronobacter condimenti 1330 TaxID=1073999 RepID=A0ABM5VGS2_9ENTR|nr:PilN domain-containing protein [Cronobacter condimenti]ALB64379.1 pilus assembly protein HofN [Cronobacter condimenti 1330]
MRRHINLLPWRHVRRRTRLIHWGSFFTFAALAAVLATGFAHGILARQLRAFEQRAEKQANAITGYKTTLREARRAAQTYEALRLRWQRRESHRQSVAAWEQRLQTLADTLPDSLWLTALRFHDDRLELTGNAYDAQALPGFEETLQRLTPFTRLAPGEMRREKEGYWRFHLSLHKDPGDAITD